jgi:hypothetical protein
MRKFTPIKNKMSNQVLYRSICMVLDISLKGKRFHNLPKIFLINYHKMETLSCMNEWINELPLSCLIKVRGFQLCNAIIIVFTI